MIGALLAVPGSSLIARADGTQTINVAVIAPRDTDLSKSFLRLDRSLRATTQNAWGVKLYAGGIAGDENDVLRKMKIGQIHLTTVTSIGLSQIVRETTILNLPGIIRTYAQVEAVQAAMNKEWEAGFNKAGYRLLRWGETGRIRWFAAAPLTRPSAIKTMRPWVWPASSSQKGIMAATGATGVPLGVPEVYGALQTGIIDMVVSTPIALVSLQWHGKLKYMTKTATGVLVGALIVDAGRWKQLPPEVQTHVEAELNKNNIKDRDDIRQADERAYASLLKRGYTANEWAGDAEKEYEAMVITIQNQLVGRMYPATTLARIKELVASAK
jgi:TRAP-type C4-dicarboxylate transport system substrate-binding protein